MSGQMKVGAIIQARMGSTRLPGKIMMKLPSNGEHSILKHIIIALKKSKSVDFIVLATSHEKEDDVLESFAKAENILFSRGSSSNVLQRFYETNVKHGFDHILRVTADNPFVDYELIDQSVKNHLESGADYSKTIGLPVGMNLEVFSKHALDATMEATDKTAYDEEHVTPYIVRSAQFDKNVIEYSDKLDVEELRLTIDFPADYAMASIIFSKLGENEISLNNIVKIVKNEGWISEINMNAYQKKKFETDELEIIEAIKQLDILEMNSAKNILQSNLKNINK